MSDPNRLCVLTDDLMVRWQILALERAIDRADATISLVVVNDPETATTKGSLEGADSAMDEPRGFSLSDLRLFGDLYRQEGAWSLVLAEQKLAWMLFGTDERWEYMRTTRVDDIDCLEDADLVCCTPDTDGTWNELPDSIVELIDDEADVVVRFGFGLIRGAVLDATKHGILSFHPADIRKYRGQGPEQAFVQGDDEIGITLQRLNEDIDSGEIVAFDTAEISGRVTLSEIWARIYEQQMRLLSRGLRNIQDPDFEPIVPDTLGDYYSHEQRRRLRFAGPIALRNFARRVR